MFTGIVQGTANIVEVLPKEGLNRLVIEFPAQWTQAVARGASVAINGTCLTVVGQTGNRLHFDVMRETLTVSTLGQLREGDRVNFERAARIGDEIGGHLLSGHVHTQAKTARIERTENNVTLKFEVPSPWLAYIFPKGFIAVDGASLTVGTVDQSGFSVHLIPETLRATRFDGLQEGDAVNIEVDSQTQTIVDTLERLGYKAST